MRTFIIGLSVLFFFAQKPVLADDKDKLAGSWKLLSWVMEDDVTKEQKPLYGAHPHGYAIFTATGRGMFVLTGEGRIKSPQTDAERGAALRSMVAYTGKIRIEGSKFITTVDTAWNETWVGTEQLRNFRIEGDRLYVVAMSQPQPNFDNKLMHGVLVFEREK